MRYLILFLICFGCSVGMAQVFSDAQKQFLRPLNLLDNGGFENGRAGWSASGGTFSVGSTGVVSGKLAADWNASAGSQTLDSPLINTPLGNFLGQNFVASCFFKQPGAAFAYTMEVRTNLGLVLAGPATIPSVPNGAPFSLNFVTPDSGSATGLRIRITSTTNEPAILIDDCYIGRVDGFNVGDSFSVSDWIDAGTITIGATTTAPTKGTIDVDNVKWRRIGSTAVIKYTYRQTGAGTAGSGDYLISLPSGLVANTDLIPATTLAVPGNQSIIVKSMIPGSSQFGDAGSTLSFHGIAILHSNTQFRIAAHLYGSSGLNGVFSSSFYSLGIANRGFSIEITVPIKGWQGTQTAFRPDQVANSWSGYHGVDCQWTRTNTALGDPTDDATCSFTQATNSNFGTVTAVGSVSPAITFTPSRAGRYYVCANTELGSPASPGNPSVYGRLTDGTTVIADVETRVYNGGAVAQGTATSLCGIYVANSTSPVTLKIQTAASAGQVILGSFSATTSRSAIEWSIFQIDYSLPAPLLVNSVVSPSEGITRIAHATVSGTGVVSNESGNWIDGNCTNASTTVCTFVSGFWSATPVCTATSFNATGRLAAITAQSSSSITIRRFDDTGSASATDTNVICIGPR